MTLTEYFTAHGDKMVALQAPTGPGRLYIYGADLRRGCYTDRGWEPFRAVAQRALTQGITRIAHNTWPNNTMHTDLIPLEPEMQP